MFQQTPPQHPTPALFVGSVPLPLYMDRQSAPQEALLCHELLLTRWHHRGKRHHSACVAMVGSLAGSLPSRGWGYGLGGGEGELKG